MRTASQQISVETNMCLAHSGTPPAERGALRFIPYLVTYVTLLGWHYRVAGTVSFAAAGWLLLILATATAIGDLFCSVILKRHQRLWNAPTRLLIGLLLSNLLLFLSGMVLPFGLAAHSVVLLLVALLLWGRACRAGRVRAFALSMLSRTCYSCLAPSRSLSGATTFCARSRLRPTQPSSERGWTFSSSQPDRLICVLAGAWHAV